MDLTFLLFTRSTALGERTISEIPGGHASAFCEPVSIISTPSSSIWNSSAKKELIASTTRNILFFLQKLLIIHGS